MNKENTKYLLEKYPDLFRDHGKPPTESLMCFGFECDDGWFWLINNLCESLTSYAKSNNVDVVASQVKEKYGRLRFYERSGDFITEGMIWLAEDLSGHICEWCGSTESVTQTKKGWVKTLCDNCMTRWDAGERNFKNAR